MTQSGGNLSRGVPRVSEVADTMAAPKVIAENLAWRPRGRTWELEARVLVTSSGALLRLVGKAGIRNHSFSLLQNNIPIKRLCTKKRHRNPDGEQISQPHKHTYREETTELAWAYVPDDVAFGDINSEFHDFLVECNISLAGDYQALML